MTWIEFDKYLKYTIIDNEVRFTEEDGSGVLEYLRLLLPLYNVDYTARLCNGSGKIAQDEVIIHIDDFNDNLKDDVTKGAYV